MSKERQKKESVRWEGRIASKFDAHVVPVISINALVNEVLRNPRFGVPLLIVIAHGTIYNTLAKVNMKEVK